MTRPFYSDSWTLYLRRRKTKEGQDRGNIIQLYEHCRHLVLTGENDFSTIKSSSKGKQSSVLENKVIDLGKPRIQSSVFCVNIVSVVKVLTRTDR